MAQSGKQIAVTTTLLARPGEEKALIEVLEALAATVRREEPGCLLYQPVRSAYEPTRFLVIERYRDEQALTAHVNSAHFREALAGLMQPLATLPEVAIYESFEPE